MDFLGRCVLVLTEMVLRRNEYPTEYSVNAMVFFFLYVSLACSNFMMSQTWCSILYTYTPNSLVCRHTCRRYKNIICTRSFSVVTCYLHQSSSWLFRLWLEFIWRNSETVLQRRFVDLVMWPIFLHRRRHETRMKHDTNTHSHRRARRQHTV